MLMGWLLGSCFHRSFHEVASTFVATTKALNLLRTTKLHVSTTHSLVKTVKEKTRIRGGVIEEVLGMQLASKRSSFVV